MSETFVKEESIGRETGIIAVNRRLFNELPGFWKLFPLTFAMIILASAAPSIFRWYTGNFSNASPPYELPYFGELPFLLSGLLLITAIGIACRILAWALFEVVSMWTSQSIHHRMVNALSRTRTTYFDEHPSARLINRLVRDYDEVRSTAIIFVGDILNASIEVLSIAIVAGFAHPLATLLAVPLLGIFFYIQSVRASMLDHARSLSSRETSAVIAREIDLIEGRSIFLIYGKADHLLRRMHSSLLRYMNANHLTARIEMWTTLWTRFSSELFSLLVLIALSFTLHEGKMGPALAGVVISSLFGITSSIGWLDFAATLVSRSAPHVRRVFEIVDLKPEETEERAAPLIPAPRDAPAYLTFENYRMSYRADTPVVLGGIDLTIRAGEKVALVGRTGSGKTSVIQSLLRMVHVHAGDIRIDGKSIYADDLYAHRRKFGVVPQFPYLFEGPLRANLDRTGELADEDLKKALEQVGVSLPLDHAINEGGTNLSLGERQLICLARVLAAKRSIILMDEPTSGLDPTTDAKMIRVLREAFADRTVITIAHRLESLRVYDRVIELSDGAVRRSVSPEAYLREADTLALH